jgi:redox-sensitive bicupin YhaK (pirin superfamily)
MHSEFNPSKSGGLHFLQIWILPERQGLPPSYEQKPIPRERGKLSLIGARQGGVVTIHQDVQLWAGLLGDGDGVQHELAKGRHAWLHVARGALTLNGDRLAAGDAAAIDAPGPLALRGDGDAELLLFDLA